MSLRNWSPDIVALGDRIASLSADQATLLKQYLADAHAIHAASLVVTPPVDEPDVLVENGVAGPAAFDVEKLQAQLEAAGAKVSLRPCLA